MHDTELISILWQRYSYRDAQGLKSDRKKIIEDYEAQTGKELKYNTLKDYVQRLDKERLFNDKEPNTYIADEPTHVSERYIEVPTSAMLTPDDVARKHGRDPEYWEVVTDGSTRSKIGTNGNDEGYFINTYSKATFRPKTFKVNEELIAKLIKANTEPVYIESLHTAVEGCLEINLADLHFGFNSIEYYMPYLTKLVRLIKFGWEKIVITTGGDLVHVDNINGTTLNGTVVGTEEMFMNAYGWAKTFVETLAENSIENAEEVEMIYILGNHDSSVSWVMAKQWEEKYPQIKHNTDMEQWKYFKYKQVFVGLTHGDKGKFQDLDRTISNLFRQEMADCKTIEVHSQDKHHEKALDQKGVILRILGSPTQMNTWTKRNAFLNGRKAIECFVWSEKHLEAHYYIEP